MVSYVSPLGDMERNIREFIIGAPIKLSKDLILAFLITMYGNTVLRRNTLFAMYILEEI